MAKKHLAETEFGFIRYANVWEDPVVLLEGLVPKEGARLLSIASAGDNCFSLLLSNPELVIAADLNAAQFHLIDLKIAAIRQLEQADLYAFLGFCTQRRSPKSL